MKTQLNYKAYLSGGLFLVIPVLAWIFVLQIGQITEKITSLLYLVTLLCWGIFAYTLLMEYWEYECDDKAITMKNLVTKKQETIDLKDISNIELKHYQVKNGHYHNIKIILKNQNVITLKGLYIENVAGFYHFLKTKIG